jgi:hypothetical protein
MDTAKALDTFKDDYLAASLEIGSGEGLVRASMTLPIYMQMMAVTFVVTEPVVAGWKLAMFNSRTDALILRSLALLVNNSVKEGRELADIEVLEACFNRATRRCPSAMKLMDSPNWAAARQKTVHSAATNDETSRREAPSPNPSADDRGVVTSSTTEPGTHVKPSTRERMSAAREHYGAEQLQATLSEAPNLVRFSDLDRAMQVAIDTVVRAISAGRSEEVRRYCGSTLITGYIVGRAMLGTAGGALHYSNPLTEADNVERLVQLSTTAEAAPYTNEIGSTGHLFMQFQIEMAGRAGPLSALPLDDRNNLAGGSAVAGLVLAIVEHDLFAAE